MVRLIRKTVATIRQSGPRHTLRKIILYLVVLISPSIRKCLPYTRLGDRIFGALQFLEKHERLPGDSMTFNDVLYRIKTTDEILDPLRVFVSDKEFVKLYVKATLGDQYNVPTLDVIRSADAVDGYRFPANCCIKPTHASGEVILRTNDAAIDRARLKGWFALNYYRPSREANYRQLKPKIIIEPLVFGNSNLEDFKFFCLNGKVKLIQVDIDRHIDHKCVYFDSGWNALDFTMRYPRASRLPVKPDNYAEMIEVAQCLSAGFGFVRVDLYSNGTKCLVGEITNCHASATDNFIPTSGEKVASEIIFGKGPWP